MISLGPTELVLCMIPVIGLVAGIVIASIAVRSSRREQTPQMPNASKESTSAGSPAQQRPWLNNGFVIGFVTGFSGGIAFMGAYLSIALVWARLSPGSPSNTVSGVAFFIGVGLAILVGHLANRAMVRRGVDSFGYRGEGMGRVILAVVGALVGLVIGAACCGPVAIITRMLAM